MILNVFLAVACLIGGGQRPFTDVETVHAAIELLPTKPTGRIGLMDPADVEPHLRDIFEPLGGFVWRGRIFINAKSDLFQKARDREDGDFYRHALAAVIWHEMAHLDGADEAEAQRREASLWQSFVVGNRVEREAGMRYAITMAARRKEA